MAIAMPASVTGAAQTGFTTPGYTLTVDTPPDVNAKQSAITALTGTQVGASAHSVSSPFTISVFRPRVSAVLGKPNPVTGLIANVPMNTYKVITRKGVVPLAGQPTKTAAMRTIIDIPAGADTASPAEIRALLSAHIGFLNTIAAGLGDTTINAVL